MKILAIDPGESTGIAYCTIHGAITTFTVVEHTTVDRWHGIENLIDKLEPEVVVIEQFRLYPKLAGSLAFSTMVASQVLGAVKEITERKDLPLFEQAAATATKTYLPPTVNQAIEELKSPHEKDAAKHAYAFWQSHIEKPARK